MVSENKIFKVSQLSVYGSYMLPWQPEFQSNQSEILMQPFPLPDDALHEI